MRTIFMGTPGFAVPCLEHLVLNGYQVAAVYTRPDKPAGRGRGLASPPVKQAAAALGLPVVQPGSLKALEEAARLADLRPELIVVVAFGQILPASVLQIPRLGCINVHFSLLPRWRGAAPVVAAILVGDEFTGVSVMLMDEGLDTGPVLARAAVPIARGDNTGRLTRKLGEVAARFLPDVLSRWSRGEITPRPQDSSAASYCRPIAKEAGEIDWRRPAAAIWRQVRAYNPWPGAYTRWQGKMLKIIAAEPVPGKASQPGKITALPETGEAFGVETGDGILAVFAVQLEGRKAVRAADFLRGQRQFIGSGLA